MIRILVADKDPSTLSLVSTRLRPRGYSVIIAKDSDTVLRHLNRETFDLAILSSEMERVNGKLLIEVVRQQNHLSMLPIIMVTTEHEISQLIMSYERGFDDFLIKPFDSLVLQLRVAINISRNRMRSEANALTQLPGNAAIEKVIREKIKTEEKFSVLYIDINQFKSFNDRYGFEKGDGVIRQTAKILNQTRHKICRDQECFTGHIGGDDFIVVLSPDDEEAFAKSFIAEFDRIMPMYYNKKDQSRGCIEITNRKGEPETFPLMSCSVASCTNLYRPYHSLGEIAKDAAEVKSFLKSQPGSNYLRDRRSCPIEKLDQAVEIIPAPVHAKALKKEMVDPLGKILLNAGLVNEEELAKAVKQHMTTGQRLGQTLISMGLVRSEDVGRMLEKKLNVPYASLKKYDPPREMLRLFTSDFMKSHRVIPLEVRAEGLKLAMCDPFDLKTIDAIERISGLKPEPCLALEDEFEEFFEKHMGEKLQERMYG